METRKGVKQVAECMRSRDTTSITRDTMISVVTINGSITGTILSLTVDPKMSVTNFKLLVQNSSNTTHEQRGPLRRMSKKGISSEFSRAFIDGHEMVDDDSTLETNGVKKDSKITFAVGKTLGNKLRRCMRKIGEDFSGVGDSEILAACLRDLFERETNRRSKGGMLMDELYEVFDTDFDDFEGVHEGYLTVHKEDGTNGSHIQWLVEEKVDKSFPFKTHFGIPVYTRLYRRMEQSIVGHPHPGSLVAGPRLASTGYFGGRSGQRMACTAHFAGNEGSAVLLGVRSQQVGSTIVSNTQDDFAIVAMNVPCTRTGQVSTSRPRIGDTLNRPATFQSAAIPNARIVEKTHKKYLVYEQGIGSGPVTSQAGDSNTPWQTPGGRPIGLHRSGAPDGSMSVVRLDTRPRAASMEPPRRSLRVAEGPNKKQKTDATA